MHLTLKLILDVAINHMHDLTIHSTSVSTLISRLQIYPYLKANILSLDYFATEPIESSIKELSIYLIVNLDYQLFFHFVRSLLSNIISNDIKKTQISIKLNYLPYNPNFDRDPLKTLLINREL